MIFPAGLLLIAATLAGWLSPPPSLQTIRLERNQFNPREIRARAGDTLRFVNGQGGPHNVMFEKDSIPAAAQKPIDAAFGKQRLMYMASQMLILEGETFSFVVPDLPPGRYPLFCNPHFAQMRGGLIIER